MVISIIGCGGVGSRHLQAIAKSSYQMSIECVDVNEGSIALAQSRFEEVNSSHELVFYSSIDLLSDEIELVIVATNAHVRRDVVLELLYKKKVKNIILEKLAFQTSKEFDEVIAEVQQQGVNCWVNCHLRAEEIYKETKQQLNFNDTYTMLYTYPESFNLATCLIHIADLFCFLTNSNEYEIDFSGLDNRLYESRHKGFIELKGDVIFSNTKGDILNLRKSQSNQKETLEIKNTMQHIVVHEQEGKIELLRDGETLEIPYRMQSELTHLYIEDILETGNAFGLSTLENSYIIHKILLSALAQHLGKERVNIT